MNTTSNLKLASRVRGLTGYSKSASSVPTELRLDSNEGVAPPLEIVVDGELLPADLLNRYPNDLPLRTEIASFFGIDADEVICTAGADDALDRICRVLLEPGRNMVVPVPTFEMIQRYAALAGGTCKEVPWPSGTFPVDQVLAEVDEKTSAIVLVTPNNPTGAVASVEDLCLLSQRAPQCVLVLDLAYGEYSEQAWAGVLEIPNLIVTRTFSKAWGLAGLRVGYALACKPLIQAMRAAGGPYPVSPLSLELARRQWIGQRRQMEQQVRETEKIRSQLSGLLRRADCLPQASQANFVLAKSTKAEWLKDGLAGMGVGVRGFTDREELKDCVRIGCPANQVELSQLEQALATVQKPEALLFDMDGVLADVSSSFRMAILQTCSKYGIQVDLQQIENLKLEGGYNNDWSLTQALLQQRGIRASLDEIRTIFDQIYLGDPVGSGLCRKEQLLMSKQVLERLASTMPLAVVTGRPRADAQMFLERFDLESIFQTVVAMEDAPSKPNPAPVQLAMERQNIQRAWMIGDTVDDIRAARAAKVLPIGVLAPGGQPAANTTALLQAGAARVLRNGAEMEELLR
jgi:histidinol-phosphate aminotransferase